MECCQPGNSCQRWCPEILLGFGLVGTLCSHGWPPQEVELIQHRPSSPSQIRLLAETAWHGPRLQVYKVTSISQHILRIQTLGPRSWSRISWFFGRVRVWAPQTCWVKLLLQKSINNWEKLEYLYTALGNLKYQYHFGKLLEVSRRRKDTSILCPRNSTHRYVPRINKCTCP